MCNWITSVCVFFFKQKTAYEMRISDWSSDVCSSDLPAFKARMIAEENVWPESDIIDFLKIVALGWPVQFEMDPDFNYEPKMDESIAARATAAGVSPAEYAYELLMKDDGKGFIYFPILNYRDGNLNFLEALQAAHAKIGRESGRERVCRDVKITGVAV